MQYDSPDNREVERARAEHKLAEPGALDEVCEVIVRGGTLYEYAERYAIPHHLVVRWIEDTDHGERIERYDRAKEHRGELVVERILHELRKISLIDIRGAFKADGALKAIHDIPKDVASLIAGLEVAELWEGQGKAREVVGEVKKIKFIDRLKAIELLMKKHALLTEKVEHSGTVTLEDIVTGDALEYDPPTISASGSSPGTGAITRT